MTLHNTSDNHTSPRGTLCRTQVILNRISSTVRQTFSTPPLSAPRPASRRWLALPPGYQTLHPCHPAAHHALVTRDFEATVTGVTAGDARLRGDGAYDKILLILSRVLVLTRVRWFRSILTSLATNAARLPRSSYARPSYYPFQPSLNPLRTSQNPVAPSQNPAPPPFLILRDGQIVIQRAMPAP